MNHDQLLKWTAERCANYVRSISERRVFPEPSAIEGLSRLGGELADEGESPEAVLALLDDAGSPATVATTGGRYFGFVNGGTLPASLAVNWLAGTWDQNAGLRIETPVGAYV